ncbi:MAG TPA: hypothetical protein VFJ05_04430 [Nitrososphaeraceae archaeon]|nr:hypothetical protein [Nitrososphaeraceae archaeon]
MTFVVKKLSQNSNRWETISLIDENGSFRGSAVFETRDEAQKYLEEYKRKLKDRKLSMIIAGGRNNKIPQELKVFETD